MPSDICCVTMKKWEKTRGVYDAGEMMNDADPRIVPMCDVLVDGRCRRPYEVRCAIEDHIHGSQELNPGRNPTSTNAER